MSDASEHLRQTLRALLALLKLVRLHADLNNVVFAQQIPALLAPLGGVFQEEAALTLEGRDGLALANRRLVRGLSSQNQAEWCAALEALGVEAIWFGRLPNEAELKSFLSVVQLAGGQPDPALAISRGLAEWGLSGKLRVARRGEGGGTKEMRTVQVGEAAYFPLAYARLLVLLSELARSGSIPELQRYFRQKLHRAAGELASLAAHYPDRLLALTTLRPEGPPRLPHLASVGLLALLVGQRLGFAGRQLADLMFAAVAHDLGAGRGEADPHQRALQELVEARELSPKALMALLVSLQRAGALPRTEGVAVSAGGHPFARVIEVCRDYDALTRGLSGPPLPPDEVLGRIVNDRSGRYDRVVARALGNLIGHIPPGAVVTLSTGEVAVVLQANPGFPGRPLVAVARGPGGEDGGGRLLDLAEVDLRGRFRVEVTGNADAAALGIKPHEYLLG